MTPEQAIDREKRRKALLGYNWVYDFDENGTFGIVGFVVEQKALDEAEVHINRSLVYGAVSEIYIPEVHLEFGFSRKLIGTTSMMFSDLRCTRRIGKLYIGEGLAETLYYIGGVNGDLNNFRFEKEGEQLDAFEIASIYSLLRVQGIRFSLRWIEKNSEQFTVNVLKLWSGAFFEVDEVITYTKYDYDCIADRMFVGKVMLVDKNTAEVLQSTIHHDISFKKLFVLQVLLDTDKVQKKLNSIEIKNWSRYAVATAKKMKMLQELMGYCGVLRESCMYIAALKTLKLAMEQSGYGEMGYIFQCCIDAFNPEVDGTKQRLQDFISYFGLKVEETEYDTLNQLKYVDFFFNLFISSTASIEYTEIGSLVEFLDFGVKLDIDDENKFYKLSALDAYRNKDIDILEVVKDTIITLQYRDGIFKKDIKAEYVCVGLACIMTKAVQYPALRADNPYEYLLEKCLNATAIAIGQSKLKKKFTGIGDILSAVSGFVENNKTEGGM